jgi:hypothetical protein
MSFQKKFMTDIGSKIQTTKNDLEVTSKEAISKMKLFNNLKIWKGGYSVPHSQEREIFKKRNSIITP